MGLTPSMGGPQRLVERAGPARARELVYTGALVRRRDAGAAGTSSTACCPTTGFDAAARAFAMDLATGPTVAHAADQADRPRGARGRGRRPPTRIVPEVAGALFDTEDLKGAVASFLEHGPGKATFAGR